ncbi:MAG: phosphoglucosamine mutase [Acidobacteria bacterium]|nr:MAG: phosphoglucosamine mutase [Acidobacteriota bacterium]
MSTKLFGTDGIRACAGEFPLNAAAIDAIGRAIGEKLGGKVLIGQDTRISSPWIFEHLQKGFSGTPAMIQNAGVIPTPAIALLTKWLGYSGGLMISASHNPYQDNGIKIFGHDGTKLTDADEAQLEKRIFELLGSDTSYMRTDKVPERAVTAANDTGWQERYQEILLSRFPKSDWLRGLRIVLDCANGAMSEIAPRLLTKLGADVVVTHAWPNGTNINNACGAVHVEALGSAMRAGLADFGVAFDGDGDRSLFMSNSGRLIDGDAVLLLMARRMKRNGQLNPPVVVGTLMTNFSLERMLRHEGITLTRVAVGDRFIFEEMQRSGAPLGGEPSGHIIFPDFNLSGDGLLTTLKVAEAIATDRASFEDLTRDWVEAPQLLKNIPVRQKVPLETLPAIQAKMVEVDHQLQACGRLVVRYSGTEPVLRIMIESDDAARNERLMAELLTVIGSVLG